MKLNKVKRLLWLLPILCVVGLDQLTKYLAVVRLKPIDTFPIIRDVLHFTYLENRGAAFGMLADNRWVFMITSTVAIVAVIAFMMWKYPKFDMKQKTNILLFTALSFIAGGGIGNMIDRVALGYVVDFVDFRLINFAVFNVADIFVCFGCPMILLYVILDEAKAKKQKKADCESE